MSNIAIVLIALFFICNVCYADYMVDSTLVDSRYARDAPTSLYGSASVIYCGGQEGSSTDDNRAYIGFDLPSGIVSACTLAIYIGINNINFGVTETFNLFPVTRQGLPDYEAYMCWTYYYSPDSTWTQAGGDFDTNDVVGSIDIVPGSGWHYIELDTNFINSLIRGDEDNNGVLMFGETPASVTSSSGRRDIAFRAKDYSGTAYDPRVSYWYTGFSDNIYKRRRR